MKQTVSVEKYVEVDVDLGDFDNDSLIEECENRGIVVPVAGSDHEAVIEAAYLAAKAMPVGSIPQAIRDLLWKVHGRAIA